MRRSSATLSVKQIDTTAGGGWTAIASAPTVDRDGEIIDAYAFEPLPPSVPVHLDHDLRVGALAGRARPYYDALGVLHVDGTFADTAGAQECRSLIASGMVDAMSVAFATKDAVVGSDGVRHITQAELFSVDFVSVPSNRDARVLSVRSVVGRAERKNRWVTGAQALKRVEELQEMHARLRYLGNLKRLYFGDDT